MCFSRDQKNRKIQSMATFSLTYSHLLQYRVIIVDINRTLAIYRVAITVALSCFTSVGADTTKPPDENAAVV